MRSSLVAIALAACNITNLHEPIGVVGKDLTPEFSANLEEAAACWNLQLGVPFVTGDAASNVEQHVDVQFDETTCLVAAAQTQGGWPEDIDICPEQYWSQLGGPYIGSFITPFRVLSHELGHVANIVGHPDDPIAVMRSGGEDFTPMFQPVDLSMFTEFNAGFKQTSACNQVVRSFRPGTGQTISHCACDTGPLDPDQPIAIVPGPEVDPSFVAKVEIAEQCWNLHYGLQLVTRAPQAGDQPAYLEVCGENGRALDNNSVFACTYDPAQAGISAMDAISLLLGVHHGPDFLPAPPFSANDDTAFAAVYGSRMGCTEVVENSITGACTCNDP